MQSDLKVPKKEFLRGERMLAMLKSKIHGAVVTGTLLEYDGSLRVDESLLKAARMLPGEMIHVWNVSNGNRFRTYVVPGKKGGITVMGAAARLCRKGDKLIVAAETFLEEKKAEKHRPKVIFVDGKNRIKSAGKRWKK